MIYGQDRTDKLYSASAYIVVHVHSQEFYNKYTLDTYQSHAHTHTRTHVHCFAHSYSRSQMSMVPQLIKDDTVFHFAAHPES